MKFIPSTIKIINLFFSAFFITCIFTVNYVHAAQTLVMFPLRQEIQKILFPNINVPINFLIKAQNSGRLPLNNAVAINPHSLFLVLDINNTLVLIDEIYLDTIIKTVGIEKRIIAQCTSDDLFAVNAMLYHPTNNTLISLIPELDPTFMGPGSDQNLFTIEKKIVVVITSYNNKDWYKKNLDSVFMQKYTNYRLIYIDDCSPDGTGKLVKAYIKEKGQEYRTTLVQQSEWKSQMANHYYAFYMCDDDEIICHLDGDDWLFDENVLSTVNQEYLTKDIWITYGIPPDTNGQRPPVAPQHVMEKVIKKNSYRKEGCWAFACLRTFNAWLSKLLRLQDVIYKGNFANMAPAPDVAMMYPMLEMAGFRTLYIPKDLYMVNRKNPISQCNITPYQVISELDRTMKLTWPEYDPLYRPIINRIAQYENLKADLVLFAENITRDLSATVNALNIHLKNLNKIIIVYEKKPEIENQLQQLQSEFPNVMFLDHDLKRTHFKALLAYLLTICGDYLVFTSSDFIINQNRDISFCIKELERTFADGFYLHLNYSDELRNLYAPLSDKISAWQPGYTKHIWPNPNAFGMILYRKKDIEVKFRTINCTSIQHFKDLWAHQEMSERAVGLFFKY